jgi:iron complex transport system substrate-binding protein
MTSTRKRLPVLALACATLICGCRGADSRDPASGLRPRVVSLLPNATEILFALDAGRHVVGATRYCDRPDAARAVPRVGGILDVSVEAVLAARPDVVIGSPSVLGGRLATLLAGSGTALVPLRFETARDVAEGILSIGRAVGREAQAAELAAAWRRDLDALDGRARRDPPLRVLFIVGRTPLVVAGGPSFLGDLLDRMGVVNVADTREVAFPTWSLEQVLQARADVVIDGVVEAGDMADVLAGAGVAAVREGRLIRGVDPAILRPGPATATAALALADRILEVAGGR